MTTTIPLRRLVLRGLLAVVLSLIGTVGLVWAVTDLGLVEAYGPLTVPPVVGLTILVCLAATAVYGAFTRIWPRPDALFFRVAGIVLVVSWFPDLALLRHDPDATVGAVVVLMAMNAIVAGMCMVALTDRFSPVPAR